MVVDDSSSSSTDKPSGGRSVDRHRRRAHPDNNNGVVGRNSPTGHHHLLLLLPSPIPPHPRLPPSLPNVSRRPLERIVVVVVGGGGGGGMAAAAAAAVVGARPGVSTGGRTADVNAGTVRGHVHPYVPRGGGVVRGVVIGTASLLAIRVSILILLTLNNRDDAPPPSARPPSPPTDPDPPTPWGGPRKYTVNILPPFKRHECLHAGTPWRSIGSSPFLLLPSPFPFLLLRPPSPSSSPRSLLLLLPPPRG